MNGSARWKEDRIRERIYLEQLKHTETEPNGAGLNGANSQGGTPVLFLQQTLGSRRPNRRKKNRLPWNILRVALLVAWVAICVWVYLGQFGIH
jgi:cytochrome c-type biogenesis protein CcmH/NrfG